MANSFSKLNGMSLLCQEDHESIFLHMMNFELSKQKLEFQKTYIYLHEPDSFPCLKTLLMILVVILTNVIVLILYNKIGQHLKDLHTSGKA